MYALEARAAHLATMFAVSRPIRAAVAALLLLAATPLVAWAGVLLTDRIPDGLRVASEPLHPGADLREQLEARAERWGRHDVALDTGEVLRNPSRAELGVRVNMVNPDAVFGNEKISSGLWDLIGPDRMKSRGLDPEGLREYYRQRNLLKVSVQAEHVGNAVVFFASEQTPTTGASLPVDGGVPSAFPR